MPVSPILLTFTTPSSNCSTAVHMVITGTVHIDWGDGNSSTLTSDVPTTHTYATAGTYAANIHAQGGANATGFGDPTCAATSSYLTAVTSWGTFGLTSLAGAFNNITGTIHTIAPIPTTITNLSNTFYCSAANSQSFLPDISGWNTANVTTTAGMFQNVQNFNQNISRWNVGNVSTMSNMFNGATTFNQNLGAWNINSLNTATNMFLSTNLSTANVNALLSAWSQKSSINTGVTIGFGDHAGLPEFYGPDEVSIAGYNTLATTYGWTITGLLLEPIRLTFSVTSPGSTAVYLGVSGSATINWGDGNSSAVSSTGSHSHNYSATGTYYAIIYDDNAHSITSFGDPSCNTLSTYLTAVTSWGYYNITSLAGAFNNLTGTIASIAAIPSTVTNLNNIFYCSALNTDTFLPDITGWDTTNVTQMNSMFTNTAKFNQNITGWNTANVTDMGNILNNAREFNQNLGRWSIPKVQNMASALSHSGLSPANFHSSLYNWSKQPVQKNVTLGADGLVAYNSGLAGINTLAYSYGWNIEGEQILATQLTYNITVPNTIVTFNLSILSGTVTIYWGDALNTIYPISTSGFVSFIYLYTGTYNVIIDGTLSGFGVVPGSGISTLSGAQYLTAVTNFGQPGLTYCNFIGSSNLTSVPATIPTTLTNFYAMFSGCTYLNDANISAWDVSSVTTMDYLFNGAASFNQDISGWNVGNVTSMNSTFCGAYAFNKPLGQWNTSNVTNMSSLFNGTNAFNQDISGWDTSKVTNMSSMFYAANAFNSPVNPWNTSAVTNMSYMFNSANAFNKPLDNWSTGNVTTMSTMFSGASAFNQPINTWNTSSVTTMDSMFNNARSFNQSLNGWDTGNVTNMTNMFDAATAFNGDITAWNVSKVTNMNYLFRNMSFNQNISGWNTAALTSAAAIFQGNGAFNQPVGLWNTANLTNITYAFFNARAFNQNVNSWITANINNLSYTFYGATAFNQNLASANVTNVSYINPGFSGTAMSIDNLSNTLIGWAAQSVRSSVYLDVAGLYYNAAGYAAAQTLRTTKSWTINGVLLQPIQLTFYFPSNGSTAIYLGVSGTATVNWGDSTGNSVTTVSAGLTHNYSAGTWTANISGATPTTVFQFGDPSAVYISNYLTAVNTYGGFNLTSLAGAYNSINGTLVSIPSLPPTVTNINSIFAYARNLSLDISQWDVSAVQNMGYMLRCASGQTGCYNPSITSWNTKSVTNLQGAFLNNTAFNQNIGGWNTANVTTMNSTFSGATAFNQYIGSWITSSVTDMSGMFVQNAAFNNVGFGLNWNTANVTTMANMFNGATAFTQNLANFNVANVTTMAAMLNNTAISVNNFNSILSSWSGQSVRSNVTLGAQGLVFNGSAAIQGFATLRSAKSWTISGTTSISSLSQYSGYPFTFEYYSYTNLPVNGRTYTLSDGSNVIASFVASSVTNTSTYSFPATLFTGGNHVFTITDTSGSVFVFSATVNISFICFKEDTKILCLKYDREEYVPIQKLRKGDLVKTLRSGYVPLDMIGKTRIQNPGTKERVKDQLYVCKQSKYPEVFEDLYITGAHSILVDKLTKNQKRKMRELFEHVCVTEGKYRLMACIDERSVPYEKSGEYNIYHIALANDDPYSNYGVYANGLLVESCSKRFLLELSNMEII